MKKMFLHDTLDQIKSKIQKYGFIVFIDSHEENNAGHLYSIFFELQQVDISITSKKGIQFVIGIPCQCCTPAELYKTASRLPSWATPSIANLFGRISRQQLHDFIESIQKEIVLVTNPDVQIFDQICQKATSHYRYDQGVEALADQIQADFGTRKGLVYLVAAGEQTIPLILELIRKNPENSYLDFRSAFEPSHQCADSHNCCIYDPREVSMDVSVICTLYRRPDKLAEQLDAIENQTLKPKEIILFHDATSRPGEVQLDESLKSRFSNIITVDQNVGVWGRFAGGLLATSKYVCFFDDDTIPGSRWLENCHTQMMKRRGIYGAIGIDAWNIKHYPHDGYVRWGWANPNHRTKEVDFVGHSWFLEKDWLGAMWINNSDFYHFKYVAEDAFLSFSARKWLHVKTFVPPHPPGELEWYGSLPKKAVEYGEEELVAISKNPLQFENMNKALRLMIKKGYPAKPVSLASFFNRTVLIETFLPRNSRRYAIIKKLFRK